MTFSLNDPEVNISPLETSINSSNRDGLKEETRVLSSAFVSLIILYTFSAIPDSFKSKLKQSLSKIDKASFNKTKLVFLFKSFLS